MATNTLPALLDLYNRAWKACGSWIVSAHIIPEYKVQSMLRQRHISPEQFEEWRILSGIRETLASWAASKPLTQPIIDILLERATHVDPAALLSLSLLFNNQEGRKALVDQVDRLVPNLILMLQEFYQYYHKSIWFEAVGCETMHIVESLLSHSGRVGMEALLGLLADDEYDGDSVVLSLLAPFSGMLAGQIGRLGRYLNAKNPPSRASAARLLGLIQDPAVLPILLNFIQKGSDMQSVIAAASAIVDCEDDASLQTMLDQFNRSGEVAIAYAFLHRGDKAAAYVPRVMEKLKSIPADALSDEYIDAMAKKLGDLGAPVRAKLTECAAGRPGSLGYRISKIALGDKAERGLL